MVKIRNNIDELEKELEKILNILKKEKVEWPYQKVGLNEFNRNYFPFIEDLDELKKFHSFQPNQLIAVVENKLRTVNSLLKPLETNLKALRFQYQLLNLFSIYNPEECIEILKKTPKGIREGFTSEKSLELAALNNINQKQVAEIMNLWLNMRYYGALSCSLSPKFMIPTIKEGKLKEKINSIKSTIEKSEPDLENRHKMYNEWVFAKQKLDEERKLMSFGPESVQIIEDSLNAILHLSKRGEINRDQINKVLNLIDAILTQIEEESKKENKILIPKDKKEKLIELKGYIKNKPNEFFEIAQIVNAIVRNQALNDKQVQFLKAIIEKLENLPENLTDLSQNPTLIDYLKNIFEPLEDLDIEKLIEKSKSKKKGKLPSKIIGYKLLEQIINLFSVWITEKITNKKDEMKKFFEIFSGVPLVLINKIAELINKKEKDFDIDEFKSNLISFLAFSGIYELYNKIGFEKKVEEEIEVSNEILIPPQPDQRLAPIQKQIKFEFMKFMETAEFENEPIFDFLESKRIPPILIVDSFIEASEKILIDIINLNSKNALYKLVNLNKDEYEVKLKTLKLKLQLLLGDCEKELINLLKNLKIKKKIKTKTLLKQYKEKIREIWIKKLIVSKKIEIKPPEEIGTKKVSEIAAKLMQKKASISSNIPPKAPPIAGSQKASKIPPRAISTPPSRLPPKAPTPVPPKATTLTPPKASTPVPPKATTLTPPKASTPVPPKASTPVPPKAPTPTPPKAPTPTPPKASTPVPPKATTLTPPKATTPVPPKATTLTPPKAPTPTPPKASTPTPLKTPNQISLKDAISSSHKISTSTPLKPSQKVKITSKKIIESEKTRDLKRIEIKNEELNAMPEQLSLDIPPPRPSIKTISANNIDVGFGTKNNENDIPIENLNVPYTSKNSVKHILDGTDKNLMSIKEDKKYGEGEIEGSKISEINGGQKGAALESGVINLASNKSTVNFKLEEYGYETEEEDIFKEKTEELKIAIDDAMDLIQQYIADIDKISPQVLKSALKLIYEIRKTDIKDVKIQDVRKIIDLAEELKSQKEVLETQTKKLKNLETKLTEKTIESLETKLTLVVLKFDEYIEFLQQKIEILSNRSGIILEELSKKFGKQTRLRRKIIKGTKKLTEHVDILKRISDLTPEDFKKAKELYLKLKIVRQKKNTKKIHQITNEMSKLLNVELIEFQRATRDKILKNSIDDLFSSK
ncbi:MAG: hypothetical protein ACTSUG_15235 [Candidatus Helarchaeota archaeon]